MIKRILLFIGVTFFISMQSYAASHFNKVLIVIFENTDYQDALRQPFFKQFADQGALLTNFSAETHPSQGNYIALTSGSTYNVNTDSAVNLNVSHIGDLLEAKGMNWKLYAEQYPGNCFTGNSGQYVRKHVPFMSYQNIQRDRARCGGHIVDSSEFDRDAQSGSLPTYSIYVPDMRNDGHGTGVAYADRWFSQKFGRLLSDPNFMNGLLIIATFDESSLMGGNHIYSALYGDMVASGSTVSAPLNHYSILKLIEDELSLGNLGKYDASANSVTGIWK